MHRNPDDIIAWKCFALPALCEANLSVTGAFSSQMASNTEHWCFLSCQKFEMKWEEMLGISGNSDVIIAM